MRHHVIRLRVPLACWLGGWESQKDVCGLPSHLLFLLSTSSLSTMRGPVPAH